jgi:hypothetical protein
MARLLMQRALSAEWLDSLFEQHRQRQSTRELLFSTEVDLMALVALGLRPSLHAAAQSSEGLKVSMQALPGQALVVYAPEWDLVVDLVPAEDAHAQERAFGARHSPGSGMLPTP